MAAALVLVPLFSLELKDRKFLQNRILLKCDADGDYCVASLFMRTSQLNSALNLGS